MWWEEDGSGADSDFDEKNLLLLRMSTMVYFSVIEVEKIRVPKLKIWAYSLLIDEKYNEILILFVWKKSYMLLHNVSWYAMIKVSKKFS